MSMLSNVPQIKAHASDCAVHNGPALPAGPCDCAELPAKTAAEAHAELIRKLTELPPPAIKGKADADAVNARVEHMRAIQRITNEYTEAVAADTTDHLPGRMNYAEADLIILDAINEDSDWDVIPALALAGCRLRSTVRLAIAA